MRRRPWLWLCLSMICFVGAAYFWRLGDRWGAQKPAAPAPPATNQAKPDLNPKPRAQAPGFSLLSQPSSVLAAQPAKAATPPATNFLAYRLSNTTKTIGQLGRSDHAVILENALFDTTQPTSLPIPDHLRAQGDPGSYIVQARGSADASFQALLQQAGAGLVSYIPNNAWLVRLSAAGAQQLAASSQVQSVLPYEPYYKLKSSLLPLAVQQTPLPPGVSLNLLLFPDARDQTLAQLDNLGATVVAQDRSPFGPVVKVRPPADGLPALARLPGVQEIELAHFRVPANDLSRTRMHVATDPVTTSNYLNLTGTNVLVNVNDTGIDANHPDLLGRVFFDQPINGIDTNGHGTHVAGIIASSGGTSSTVTNASSQFGPYAGTNTQFRGVAPGASLFSMAADPLFGPSYSDSYLQETAARTNAFISNNSWNYSDIAQFKSDVASYDLAAASYDAAVRDALPFVPGPQPLLFVFAAGDAGNGLDNGTEGLPNTILSPATAKNVITVGAIEQSRFVTNEVAYDTAGGLTNDVFFTETDSSNQVASFSSRGNVGVGIEGDFGRFKPDVVAPGTFVISTKPVSAQSPWDQAGYYTTHNYFHANDVFLTPREFGGFLDFSIPNNAVRVDIRLVNRRSPSPFPDLPILVSTTGTAPPWNPIGTNWLTVNNPAIGNNWLVAVADVSTQNVAFDVVADVMTADPNDQTLSVLSNLNTTLGPNYRYESGTSMSAAAASGTLALMQQFLQEHGRTNAAGGVAGHSPALMKAMLINGARSMDNGYGLQVNALLNFQGWGLVQLPSSLPGGLALQNPPTNSMWLLDQDPTNALATGQSQTYHVTVAPGAQALPLRVTLAWSDPPGNPVAGIKLVNDLDLLVTNLDSVGTGLEEIYFGNDIPSLSDFNLPWDTNNVPNIDFVNNVENIYIPPPLSTNYSITVFGHRVNVNAVPEHTNNIVQDFALVVSCGDGQVTNAISFALTATASDNTPQVTVITNQYVSSTNYFGGVLQRQRVGANSPLLGTNTLVFSDATPMTPDYNNGVLTIGTTNQWHFYTINFTPNYTNYRFAVLNPVDLSIPRMGVDVLVDTNATRQEADVDFYVSRDTNLILLDPVAISNAYKMIGREGSSTLVLTNGTKGYYFIAVKAEDQMAAQYTLLAQSSFLPFSQNDQHGKLLPWFDAFAIPDGSAQAPGITNVFIGPGDPSMLIRRIIVSNLITHENVGDLIGNLTYPDGTFCVLNNHTDDGPQVNHWYIYDDSGEGDVPFARHTDGPGTLHNFAGKYLGQLFNFFEEDNQLGHVGTNEQFLVFLEKQPPLTQGVLVNILPGHCVTEFIDVPPQATAMTISATLRSGTGPVTMQVCQNTAGGLCSSNITIGAGASITIDQFSDPPLTPGIWSVTLCNQGSTPVTVFVIATLDISFRQLQTVSFTTNPIAPVQDDAVTDFAISVTNHLRIAGLDVGLLLSDPRVSDLAITLISPSGQRFLLSENRGAYSTNGLGTFSAFTNSLGVPGFGWTNLVPFYTNNFDDVAVGPYAPGATFDGWSVLTNYAVIYPELPAPWLSNNVLVLGEGIVSNNLPTTNSTAYVLSFAVDHAPYLVGTIGWWPFDRSGADIVGGFNGLLYGDLSFNSSTGEVNQAFFGDGQGTRMIVPRAPALDVSQRFGFTVEGWINPVNITNRAPLVEWYDPFTTNGVLQGIQFWLSGVPGTNNGLGALFANFWDTNSQPHIIATTNLVITNGGWQHVALTYDAASRSARLYTNGFVVASQVIAPPTNFVPRSAGDLYFGYDPAPVAAPVSYFNFNSVAGLSLVGNAAPIGGVLRLTPAVQGQRGNAWSTTKLPVAAGFDTRFQFQCTDQGAFPGTPLGADGITFTVQNLGPNASNFFCGLGNGSNHVSVFFNTFLNWPGCNDLTNCDISDNSVGIVTNGSYVAQTDLTPLGINLKDGRVHSARVIFDGTAISVILDNVTVLGGVRMPGLTQGTDAFGMGWVGFSAGTGAAWENQDILSWTLGSPAPSTCFRGGLDEFGLYDRALSDCEIAAIFKAGTGGKYGTNVLSCPVTNSIQLITSLGSTVYTFANGLYWTNGPQWETNVIFFTNLLGSANTNGPATNLTAIVITNLDPNATFDNFVLSAVVTNFTDGLMHFTDDTNVALLPIKFAATPYNISNNPPLLIYSNDFELVTQKVYAVGDLLPGTTNDPALGLRNWTVISNNVTVISNSLVDAATGTNCVALAMGGLQTLLPTTPGHKYQLTYSVRGPAAVSWWTGDINPLDSRAWDLLGGNDGAFIFDMTNTAPGWVGGHALYFNGQEEPVGPWDPDLYPDDRDDPGPKLELGDPENLRLTNAFAIEGWIQPIVQTNTAMLPTQQILFRGDLRDCLDPYYLALEPNNGDLNHLNLHFHIEDATSGVCGFDLLSTNGMIGPLSFTGGVNSKWWHVAAVFDKPFTNFTIVTNLTNSITIISNQLRLYLDGVCVASNFTRMSPFGDLDPAFKPGVAIGNRSRDDNTEPFRGFMDELTVYGRTLTEPEITAIVAAGRAGKADFKAPNAGSSLAKLNVTIDGVQRDLAYGDNSQWTTRTVIFTALHTNSVLALQSLLPGTIVDGITLTEIPDELTYLPEVTFAPLLGQDAFGTWQLEIWDNRAGPGALLDSNLVQLLSWQLNFQLLPTAIPPVVHLEHGILYTNSLVPGGVQDFIVDVPQWALMATNFLQYAAQYNTTNLVAVGVLYDTNGFPTSATNGILWPPVTNGTVVLTTNSSPWFYPGQSYFLAVTNTNSVSVTFAIGVSFDITSLTNCQPLSNFVWQAGIPRYFQFDVPTNGAPPGFPAQEVTFWLTGAGSPTNYLGLRSNVTVVASSHLPLPDLTHFDYLTSLPATNNDMVLVVTNSTPYPIQTNRWYIGVFSDSTTNIPLTVQACYSTNIVPILIPLTNNVPFIAGFTNQFVAPPGPPQWFFFHFTISNFVDAVLFELYDLSGNADLVLQRDVIPNMAPYFAISHEVRTAPEQIVLRTGPDMADLRGDWFLGIFNNEITSVAYTLRAALQQNGLLLSAQPLHTRLGPAGPPRNDFLVQWNSIIGEYYAIEFATNLVSPNWQVLPNGLMRATTILSTFEVPVPSGPIGFYRVRQVSLNNVPTPPLNIQLWSNNLVRISWSTNFPNETLQYATSFSGPWANLNLPVTVEGNLFVVYDTIGPVPKYYRLIP